MQEQLSAHPEVDNDEEEDIIIIDYDPQQAKQSEKNYKKQTANFLIQTFPYRLQNWYPHLQLYTFKSQYFMLTALQSYLLLQIYYQTEQSLFSKWKYQPHIITDCLKNLQNKVNKILQGKSNGMFFKLSTRSPKDYCWDYRDNQYFKETVQKLSQKLLEMNLDKQNQQRQLKIQQINQIYRFLCNDSRNRIKIRNGKDFIRIFSRSQRIIMDLDQLTVSNQKFQQYFKDFKIGNFDMKNQQIVRVYLREWEDFYWENQFRCFFYNHKLTGICSYEQDCFFKQLKQQKQTILKQCLSFFQTIKQKLILSNLDKGVMDVFFSNNFTKIKLIQINVFDQNTRASLYNWQKDQKILKEGPLQVRLRQQYSERLKYKIHSIMGMIDKRSGQVVNQALKNIKSKLFLLIQ